MPLFLLSRFIDLFQQEVDLVDKTIQFIFIADLDPYGIIAEQINLPPTLINRFDVIFTLRDIPNKDKDEKIAIHVLHEHQKKGENMAIPRELFRKYVAYAKQKIKPFLSDEAVEEIKKFSGWKIVHYETEEVIKAINLVEETNGHFWDALIATTITKEASNFLVFHLILILRVA